MPRKVSHKKTAPTTLTTTHTGVVAKVSQISGCDFINLGSASDAADNIAEIVIIITHKAGNTDASALPIISATILTHIVQSP